MVRYGAHKDAIERIWRNILGDEAAARFHRPNAGLGLSDDSKTQLQSMKLFWQWLISCVCSQASGTSSFRGGMKMKLTWLLSKAANMPFTFRTAAL